MREILERFPSLAFVARELGVGYKSVTKWAERDSIPARFDLDLIALAARSEVALSLEELAMARRLDRDDAA